MKASKTLTLQKSTQKRKSLRNPKDCTDFCSGDPAGIRTPDTLLKRQVLCLLSYWVILNWCADCGRARWLGWQDSNLQYQSQSLVCYRYTTSHHRLVQRGRHCRPPAFLGWEMGLEPTTPGTTIRCSYQLSYTHHYLRCWHARRDSNPRPTA